MHKRYLFIISSVIFSAFILLLGARTGRNNRSSCRRQLVCTTGMIADAVEAIAGEHACVHRLMGPGVDPHLYRPRERDVHKIAQADALFYNGLHLEGRMGEIFETMHRRVLTVPVARTIPPALLLSCGDNGIVDPHVWHDISLWLYAVHEIGNALAQLDPAHSDWYAARTADYVDHLKKVDKRVRAVLAHVPPAQRILVTAHDAFGYFGRAYGFKVIGLQGMSTDAQVGTKDIQELAHYIVMHNVKALFLESSIPPRSIQAVQNAVLARGWRVAIGPELFSDALGDAASGAATYNDMIMHNARIIAAALGDYDGTSC